MLAPALNHMEVYMRVMLGSTTPVHPWTDVMCVNSAWLSQSQSLKPALAFLARSPNSHAELLAFVHGTDILNLLRAVAANNASL
jgi:hypothetical protein